MRQVYLQQVSFNQFAWNDVNIISIFISGYTIDIITRQGVVEKETHFMQKPISYEELTSKVQEVLGKG
jgi:hypothetical protein